MKTETVDFESVAISTVNNGPSITNIEELFQRIKHENVSIRRAAVFTLCRVLSAEPNDDLKGCLAFVWDKYWADWRGRDEALIVLVHLTSFVDLQFSPDLCAVQDLVTARWDYDEFRSIWGKIIVRFPG